MRLSVIVPVYNVEDYICECIESLCNQTINDMEILVVDDGSKDSSIEKVKNFKDKRIRIITKENGGLSSARNAGIKQAKGKYISFIDSDDYVKEKFSLMEMCDVSDKYNSDITVGTGIQYYSKTKQEPFFRDNTFFFERVMNADDYLISILDTGSFNYTACLSLYRRSFIIKNKLYFKDGLLHEDVLYFVQSFLKAKKVAIYDKPFYMYRIREGSIMNSELNPKRFNDIQYIVKTIDSYLYEIKSKKLRMLLGNMIANLMFSYLYKYNIKNVDKKIIKVLIKNSITIKQKCLYLILLIYPKLAYRLIKDI